MSDKSETSAMQRLLLGLRLFAAHGVGTLNVLSLPVEADNIAELPDES